MRIQYFSAKRNVFHTRALKGYIDSRNKTNKCTCVKSVYHVVFIANMF